MSVTDVSVSYDINPGTKNVRHRHDILRQIRYLIQYRYRTLRLVRYDSDTGISGTDMVVSTGAGTGIVAAYIPVPDSPVNSV